MRLQPPIPPVLFLFLPLFGLVAADATAQVRLVLPDLTVDTSFADTLLGQRLATQGRHLWAVTTRPGTDGYLWYRRDPGIGWSSQGGTSLPPESGAVAVDADDGLLVYSLNGETVAAHYGPSGSFQNKVTLGAIASSAVAADGAVAAYGAPDLVTSGVYLFEWNGFQWIPLGPVAGPGFSGYGAAGLAMQGDYLFVGAPYFSGSGQTGRLYIYERDPGMACGRLYCPADPFYTAPDAEADNLYGAAVAVDGDWLAVGAPLDDSVQISPFQIRADAGIVFLYHFDGNSWILADTVRPEGFEAGDRFGSSVDLWNRSLVAGAPFDDIPAEFTRTDMGSAHVFLYDGLDWVEKSFLRSNVLGFGDQAGTDVSVGLFGAQVGAPFADSGNTDSGAIYFFDDALWIFHDGFESGNPDGWSSSNP